MRCISPIKASYDSKGDVTYSRSNNSKELEGFEFECRKCLACRLNIAREKAVRAVHEAKMHEDNIFLTLTYSDEHLASERLIYSDFQNFMKSLRQKVNHGLVTKEARDKVYIPYMVTGEYGEQTKRPHWHALLFNYRPSDAVYKYSTDAGERVFESETLSKIWKKGNLEFGSVTMESAGYVARYAAKKLVHGKDQEHNYHPIHKTSARRAIGRSWIEKYYRHTFENGFIVLNDGQTHKIPRYYVDWCKKEQPDLYFKYISEVLPTIKKKAEKKTRKEEIEYFNDCINYTGDGAYPIRRSRVKDTVLKSKFKQLQEYLKL